MRRLLPFLPFLLLFIAPRALAQRPDAPPYALRGPFPVGTQEFILEDAERPLKVSAWYPALNPDGAEERATYQEGLARLEGRALNDAPPDTEAGPYPLVVFSHGSGGLRFQSLFLTEHLASQGFVVLAPDHAGNTLLDRFADEAAFQAGLLDAFALRPLDVSRVLDFAESLNAEGALAGLMLTDKAAVIGHSFGGYTALSVGGARINFAAMDEDCAESGYEGCFFYEGLKRVAALRGLDAVPEGLFPSVKDDRVQAIVGLAPCCFTSFGAEGLAEIDVPALMISGSADPVTISDAAMAQMLDSVSSPTWAWASLQNAGHFIFVDACSEQAIQFGLFDSCSDPVWDMARAHDLQNHLTTAFLRAVLLGDTEAQAALAPEAVDFLGVVYQAK